MGGSRVTAVIGGLRVAHDAADVVALTSRPIRVAYLLGSLSAGGAERQMLLLAERLPRDQFEVDFLSMVGAGRYDGRARQAGARTFSVGSYPEDSESTISGVRRRLRMARYLVRTMRARRYDIIDAWLYPADVLASALGLLAHRPIIVTGRRNLGLHDRFGPGGAIVDMLVDRLTAAVVANSQAAADHAIRHHHVDPAKMHVI